MKCTKLLHHKRLGQYKRFDKFGIQLYVFLYSLKKHISNHFYIKFNYECQLQEDIKDIIVTSELDEVEKNMDNLL